MKKFILGFLLGAMLFGSGIAFAEELLKVVPNPFPVLINGTKTVVDGYNINGSTYLKLRDFEKAGLGVEFNSQNSQIEITSDIIASEVTSEGEKAMSEIITQTPDGITNIDTWEGQQYIGALYIRNKIREKGYDFTKPMGFDKWQIIKGDVVVLDNVPTTKAYGRDNVEVNYYINTILPLIV